jgi:hypothetical protein
LSVEEAVTVVAFAVVHVRTVVAPEVSVVGFALMEAVGTTAAFTVTLTEAAVLPPVPVQVTVYFDVPAAVGFSVTVPFMVTDPERPPEPVQEDAPELTMVKTVESPSVMLSGLAVIETVGAGS